MCLGMFLPDSRSSQSCVYSTVASRGNPASLFHPPVACGSCDKIASSLSVVLASFLGNSPSSVEEIEEGESLVIERDMPAGRRIGSAR